MAKSFHIIVADDDDDDQCIIKEAIKEINSEQVKVTSVYDGVQLVDYLYNTGLYKDEITVTADLILLDVNMPVVNGFQALERIKADNGLKNIPVYVISTMRTVERVDASRKLGARKFFTKPNHLDGYKSIMNEIIADSLG